MEITLSLLTTTIVGLMVGVEFSVAFVMNPIIHGLPFAASMAAGAHGGRMLGRAMPIWYIVSLILTGWLTYVMWGAAAANAGLVASILLFLSVVMSVALLVPINNRATTWTPESHPADWREQRQRWDSLHYARVGLIVAAFVLVAFAATQI